jgi:hypothetical protein
VRPVEVGCVEQGDAGGDRVLKERDQVLLGLELAVGD